MGTSRELCTVYQLEGICLCDGSDYDSPVPQNCPIIFWIIPKQDYQVIQWLQYTNLISHLCFLLGLSLNTTPIVLLQIWFCFCLELTSCCFLSPPSHLCSGILPKRTIADHLTHTNLASLFFFDPIFLLLYTFLWCFPQHS